MGIGTGKAWLEVGQGPCLNFEFFPGGESPLCFKKSSHQHPHPHRVWRLGQRFG
jgi:hypothetical protein